MKEQKCVFLGGWDILQFSESAIVCTGEHKESIRSLLIKVCQAFVDKMLFLLNVCFLRRRKRQWFKGPWLLRNIKVSRQKYIGDYRASQMNFLYSFHQTRVGFLQHTAKFCPIKCGIVNFLSPKGTTMAALRQWC